MHRSQPAAAENPRLRIRRIRRTLRAGTRPLGAPPRLAARPAPPRAAQARVPPVRRRGAMRGALPRERPSRRSPTRRDTPTTAAELVPPEQHPCSHGRSGRGRGRALQVRNRVTSVGATEPAGEGRGGGGSGPARPADPRAPVDTHATDLRGRWVPQASQIRRWALAPREAPMARRRPGPAGGAPSPARCAAPVRAQGAR